MKKVNWVIQQNLVKAETLERLRKAFNEHKISYEEIFIIPFSEELPQLAHPEDFNIFYGSTTLMRTAYKHPLYREGVFFDPAHFQMATYLSKWQEHLLNSDGTVISFEDFVNSNQKSDSLWFIRPNSDTKSFSGMLMSFDEIQAWAVKVSEQENIELGIDSLLFVSSPKKIDKEWRNFIVEGKVVSASRYQVENELNISAMDIPPAMIDFVEQRCKEYMPHDIFVMDVALAKDKYYILECNCFNGTGFYQSDISKIIRSVTDTINKKINNEV